MQLFSAVENAAIQESPESIQTTAEDVLELPLLPPEDVATPSNHKLSDQSTHSNPPEDVATPRTATTRAQSSALSEAAENRPTQSPLTIAKFQSSFQKRKNEVSEFGVGMDGVRGEPGLAPAASLTVSPPSLLPRLLPGDRARAAARVTGCAAGLSLSSNACRNLG